ELRNKGADTSPFRRTSQRRQGRAENVAHLRSRAAAGWRRESKESGEKAEAAQRRYDGECDFPSQIGYGEGQRAVRAPASDIARDLRESRHEAELAVGKPLGNELDERREHQRIA